MNKRRMALLLVILLALSIMAGCANQQPAAQTPVTQTPATETPTTETPATETPAAQTPAVETPAAPREITDMAGRVMTVPAQIDKVFSYNAISAIYLYTLVPDLLMGWNYDLNEIEKSVILEKYQKIPNYGMGDAINFEAVIEANPAIAFNVSAINDGTKEQSDELAKKLGVPVIMVSNKLEDAPAVYRFMGEQFGIKEQAEKLAAYAERTFSDISGMTIPEEEKVRIYYGNGEDSLETAPAGSSHGQIIDLVNAVNAADLELGDGSRIKISAEQLLKWDPDVIIVNGEPKSSITGSAAAESIIKNPIYASLKAVKNGMVFGTPNAPFSWIERPPGPNRIVGMRWLATKIYADYFDYDVDEEVREFFRLFYHIELTAEKLTKIYNGAL